MLVAINVAHNRATRGFHLLAKLCQLMIKVTGLAFRRQLHSKTLVINKGHNLSAQHPLSDPLILRTHICNIRGSLLL